MRNGALSLHVLRLLSDRPHAYGELRKAMNGDGVSLSGTLTNVVSCGDIEIKNSTDAAGKARRMYVITDAGRAKFRDFRIAMGLPT